MRFLLAALCIGVLLSACEDKGITELEAHDITTRCVELCKNNGGMKYTTIELRCEAPGTCRKKRFDEYCRCNNGGIFVR